MSKTPIDRNQVRFGKPSVKMIMNSLVTSPFDVKEGSSNSVILVELKEFSQKCIEHEVYMPFFEILDFYSQCKYTHFIDGKSIKRDSNSSGFSYYMSKTGYGIELKSGNYLHCDLLVINPTFFSKILGSYQFNGFLPSHLINIQEPCIQNAIRYLISLIKENADWKKYISNDFQLYLDQQVAWLLKLIANKHLINKYRFSNQQINDIIEYFDGKVKTNEEIGLEELIRQFEVEGHWSWLDVFRDAFKTTPYQYYMARKREVLNHVKDDRRMLLSKQKKLFDLIHELAASPESDSTIKFKESNKKLIPFLAEELGKKERTFKTDCNAIGIKPLSYYIFLCIEKAKYLLATTHKEVIEIACICGYDNHESFKRAFQKRADNLTPEQFREQYKKTSLYFS